jgi:thiamine kinase-like enzyme
MTASTPLDSVLDEVEQLAGRPREITELPGGLTNVNLKVTTPDGSWVVRRWSDDTGLLAIDRDNEYENSVRAAEVGVGAEVCAYLPEHNAMVFEFLDGRTMSPEDLRRGDLIGAVADACRTLHSARPFRDDFDMFELQPRYLRIVEERGLRLPDRYREFEPHVAAVREAFAVRPEDTVPCNNDLLAENFLLCDGRFRLIDYEYSGNNDPAFELGNTSTECDLTTEQTDELVASYRGEHDPTYATFRARVELQALCAEYGWSLWGFIQSATSSMDFDFHAWGMERFEKAGRRFTGDGFDALLDTVGSGG